MKCFLAYGFICGNILILEFDNISVPGTELYAMLLQHDAIFSLAFISLFCLQSFMHEPSISL